MLLQDPAYTRILIVTLPETTPVLEASALQDDIRRAHVAPFAWVINGSLAAAQPRDPILRARAMVEIAQIKKVREQLARRVALIPFQLEEPVGVERLAALSGRPPYPRYLTDRRTCRTQMPSLMHYYHHAVGGCLAFVTLRRSASAARNR